MLRFMALPRWGLSPTAFSRPRNRLAQMVVLAVGVALFSLPHPTEANITSFSFTSAPNNFVADNLTSFSASPATNWTITASSSFSENYVVIDARNNNLAGFPLYWTLEICAPVGQVLVPGYYPNANKNPFRGPGFSPAGTPGINLTGNNRAEDFDTGYFNILDAEYGPNNTVLSFAVDFEQIAGTNPDLWLLGKYRMNATVPEPASINVIAFAIVGLVIRRRSRCSEVFPIEPNAKPKCARC